MPFGILTALSAALQALQPWPAAEPAHLRADIAVRPPPGFLAFCATWPAECVASPDRTIRADARALALLAAVNLGVNRAIAPQPEPAGADVWRLGATLGDCDEYAIAKRHRLIGHGLPASALRLAVVRTRAGERHLVLVAATDRGDLVLDNLTDAILPVDRADLVFETIQTPDKPRAWAAVEPARGRAAGIAALIPAAR